MILKNTDFYSFAKRIKRNKKKVILFGAGSVMVSWMPYILDHYRLYDVVLYCVDNDMHKWNHQIQIGEKVYDIKSPEMLKSSDMDQLLILITSRYIASIIKQLNEIHQLDNTECYIADIMQLTNQASQEVFDLEEDEEYKIPAVINYCWFGRKQMSDHDKRCIDSWYKYCPDYEIVEWNEDNYDITKNLYMRQSYEMNKFGYTPDFARIDILFNRGGFYFDTDVEMKRNIDPLRKQTAFCSFEEYPMINFGGGSGAVKGHPMLKKILDFRKEAIFNYGNGVYNNTSCGYFETTPLWRAGLKLDGSYQKVNGMAVYPYIYFHSKSSITGEIHKSELSYSVHDFNWSWLDQESRRKMETDQNENKKVIKEIQENKI